MSKKIQALVKIGYLVRNKSSFKVSTGTKDALRKAKNATKKDKDKDKVKLKSSLDASLDRNTRVLKYLGLIPLVSNHPRYEDCTEPVVSSPVQPVPRESLPAAPKRVSAPKPAKSTPKARAATQPALSSLARSLPSAEKIQLSPGSKVTSPALMSAPLLTRNGDLRIPRSKSALNYFQDSIRASETFFLPWPACASSAGSIAPDTTVVGARSEIEERKCGGGDATD